MNPSTPCNEQQNRDEQAKRDEQSKRDESRKSGETKDRPLQRKDEAENTGTLPVGHPEAGYVSPDLSKHDQTGTLPPEEKEWHEARNQAREEEVEKVEQNEAEVEQREREEREEQGEAAQKQQEAREKAQTRQSP